MYIVKLADVIKIDFLKRSRVWRFGLRCEGKVFTACFAADQNEVLADSSEPLECPNNCDMACLVELRSHRE